MLATSIASKADAVLLPGESLTAVIPAPTSTARLLKFVEGSKALSGTISDYRIFVRLWGVLGMYTWTKSALGRPLAREASRKERVLRSVEWAEIASLWAFQILENGAYLSSKNVLTCEAWAGSAGKAKETKWWLWSCRFWAAYVVLEGVRLGTLAYYQRKEEGHGKEKEKEREVLADGEKEGKLLPEQRKKENWLWWRDAFSNAAYFPMTLHWSVDGGLMSQVGVGACGMVAGGANLVDAWRGTA